ncbi:hypothetical protein O181_002063 [Austropuccinia psidii MF-1]|uniref:Uncharacterized protein n=1 Tax=Austropuccinia psidii MF-1 TaxID=1389203 RepID=A0A9Q3BBQ8_9BASI|nr:hypothetical protein [Austropuccinia psidii MF-1]
MLSRPREWPLNTQRLNASNYQGDKQDKLSDTSLKAGREATNAEDFTRIGQRITPTKDILAKQKVTVQYCTGIGFVWRTPQATSNDPECKRAAVHSTASVQCTVQCRIFLQQEWPFARMRIAQSRRLFSS